MAEQNGGVAHRSKTEGVEAAETQRYSIKYIAVCLLGYSLSFVIFGSQVSVLGPTIKPLAERLGVTEPDLSPLFTALGISCIISGTPSGWLVDRMPTHRVLLGSLLVQAIGFSLVPLMPSVWTLTALYFVICFSYNFTNSAVFTSLGWMFPKRAASALNLVLAMFGVGSFFIPIAAQTCKYLLGSALAVFFVIGITSVVAALPFLFVSSPTPPPPVLNGDGPSISKATRQVLLLERVTTYTVVLLVFFTTAAETSIGNWLYTYGVREEGLSDDEAALGNSAFWGAFTVGRVLGAAVSHLTTPAALLLGITPLAMFGAFLPLWADTYLTPWQVVMTTAVLTGLGNSTGYANAVSLLETYMPVTGFVNGLFGMVAGAACMVGPTIVAMLAKYTGLSYLAMAWVGGTFYVLHYPAILFTIFTGTKLIKLYEPLDDAEYGGSGAAEPVIDGLMEPLLAPALATVTHFQHSQQQASPISAPASGAVGAGDGGRRLSGSLSSSFRAGSLHRQSSMEQRNLGKRTSIPGHASPILGSMG